MGNPAVVPDQAWLFSSIVTVLGALWFVVRRMLKDKSTRKALAAGLEAGLGIGDDKRTSADLSSSEAALRGTMMKLMRIMEENVIQERQERRDGKDEITRQWLRIEQLLDLARQNAEANRALSTQIHGILQSLENMGRYFDQVHRNEQIQMAEIRSSQTGLDVFIRENIQAFAYGRAARE